MTAPLRKIVETLTYGDSVFGADTVLLECSHKARSNGIYQARCKKCGRSAPKDVPDGRS